MTFEVPSFTLSEDMIRVQKKMGHMTTPISVIICHSLARTKCAIYLPNLKCIITVYKDMKGCAK